MPVPLHAAPVPELAQAFPSRWRWKPRTWRGWRDGATVTRGRYHRPWALGVEFPHVRRLPAHNGLIARENMDEWWPEAGGYHSLGERKKGSRVRSGHV